MAAVFDFGGITASASGIARRLFYSFVSLAVTSLVVGLVRINGVSGLALIVILLRCNKEFP